MTPDYVIPSNFFATGGGTLNYASGIAVWNYGIVPTDGVHSLLPNGSTAVNSPTNYRINAIQYGALVLVSLVVIIGLVLRWRSSESSARTAGAGAAA